MSYRVLSLDLTNLTTDKQELIPRNSTISEVVVFSMPAGVSIQIALGDSPLFTVNGPFSLEPDSEDEREFGLYWANPVARPGVKIEMIVAGGGSLSARNP